MHPPGSSNSVVAYWLFLALQIIFVIIFAALGRYDKALLPPSGELSDGVDAVPQSKYPRKCEI